MKTLQRKLTELANSGVGHSLLDTDEVLGNGIYEYQDDVVIIKCFSKGFLFDSRDVRFEILYNTITSIKPMLLTDILKVTKEKSFNQIVSFNVICAGHEYTVSVPFNVYSILVTALSSIVAAR